MRIANLEVELTATDLSWFLGCRHRTALDLAVARGQREAPKWVDPAVAVLAQRGLEHERAYVEALRAQGLTAIDLAEHQGERAVARTREEMAAGTSVIIQPALRDGRWFGRPDVLLRIETPSDLGGWSYQVIDTKLTRETRGGTVLQLALYSALLAIAQGLLPEEFRVVTPDPSRPVQIFRVRDYAAFFRFVRSRLEAASSLAAASTLAAS